MPTYKKYFKNKFILNGVELNNVSIGASVVGKFEEPLDEAGLHLPFTTQGYEYPMRGLLQVISEDYLGNTIDNTYIILRDAISEGSKYGEWKHDLRVMEYSGKYDAYLYHTFTYTKALKNNNPAPFRVMSDLNNASSNDFRDMSIFKMVFTDPIDLKTTYYVGEDITLPQVNQGVQATEFVSSSTRRFGSVPIWVKIDGEISTKHVLSSSPLTFQLTKGNHYIDYGFTPIINDVILTTNDITLFRFYVNAIPRNELSVYDALNIIRDSKPFESLLYHERTRLFDIDETIEEYLKSVELPQMFVQKATMRQVLNTIFSYINSISRFVYNSEGIDKLSFDEFNKITGSFDIKDIISYGSSQEAGDLFNQGIQWVERGLPSSFEEATITSPSEALYKTVRSTKSQIVDTSFEMPLEAELYQPTKFTTLIEKIEIISEQTLSSQVYDNFVLDLTTRLINREEWYLKNYTVNFPDVVVYEPYNENVGLRENRVSNLYWQQGSTSILLSDVNGEVLRTNVVFTTIYEALNEYITRIGFEPRYYYDSLLEETLLITRYALEYTLPTPTEFKDLKFQLKYISFENFAFQTHRENISNSPYYSEGRINQSDKALNIAFTSMKAHGITQRSGVPSLSFSKVYDDYTDVLRWGMIDQNDYVIVEEKFEYQNEFVVGSYVATKDHNRLSLWTGVDQEYRWTEIPRTNQVFERHELFNENIVVSNPSTVFEEETTHIKDLTLDLIFGTLMNDWKDDITNGNTKVTLAHIRTDGFVEIYPDDEDDYNYLILTPVRSFGGKHGFSFIFGFEGNQVALDKVDRVTITDGTTYWNKAVRYTDANGEFNKLWYSLATQFYLDRQFFGDGFTETERNESFPLSRVYGGGIDSDYTTHQSGSISPNDQLHNPLVFGKKDKSQSIKVSIQNSIYVHDYKEYVFGLPFYTNNFIVNNPEKQYNTTIGTTMYLYIYENGTKYNKFDTFKIKPSYESEVLLVEGSNVSYSNNQFRFNGIDLDSATSWAIGDELGNLYMACNYPYNGFNTARLHFTPDHTVIGNKTYSATITISKQDGVEGVIQMTSIVSGDTFVFPTDGVEAELYLDANPEIYYYETQVETVPAFAPISVNAFVAIDKFEYVTYSVGVQMNISISESVLGFINENVYAELSVPISVVIQPQISYYEQQMSNYGTSQSINFDTNISITYRMNMKWAVASGTTYDATFAYSSTTVYNASVSGCALYADHLSLMPDPDNYPLGYRVRVRVDTVDGEDLVPCLTYAYYIIEPDV